MLYWRTDYSGNRTMAVASQLERQIRMNIWKKVLVVSCLCAATSSPFAAYADASKSVHEATLVAAPADYENIAVSQVSDYVNIREQATTNSKIVGKIYNNCAATILETVEGTASSPEQLMVLSNLSILSPDRRQRLWRSRSGGSLSLSVRITCACERNRTSPAMS